MSTSKYTVGNANAPFRVAVNPRSVSDLGVGAAAASQTNAPPPPSSGITNPSALPSASGQLKTGTYGRGQVAGFTYFDPYSNLKVLKLTDPNYPVANNKANVHDAQVTSVSLPWGAGGVMRTVCVMVEATTFTSAYIYEINTSTMTITDVWEAGSVLAPGQRARVAGAVAFSPNPDTPRYMYCSAGPTASFQRYDTAARALLPGDGFPRAVGNGANRLGVLWVSEDEDVFCATQYNRLWWTYWTRSTNNIIFPASAVNGQGALNPAGKWGGGNDQNAGDVPYGINTTTGVRRDPPGGVGNWGHPAMCTNHRYVGKFGMDQYSVWDIEANTDYVVGGPFEILDGSAHSFGNWVVNMPEPAWHGTSTYAGPNLGRLAHAIAWIRLVAGSPAEVRLVGHHDCVDGPRFDDQPHAQCSPDGRVIVWQSNQNVPGGRDDVYLTVMPVS